MKTIIIFLMLTMLAAGCSSPPDVDTDKIKQEQTDISLIQVESILEPFMRQQTEQYKDLSAKFDALQKEHTNLQAQLTDAQLTGAGYRAELAGLKADNKSLNSEVANTKTSLQNSINEQAKLETKIAQNISEMVSLQQAAANTSEAYNTLLDKITDINNHTDGTIDDYAEAKRTIFYEIWDEWWQEEME